MTRIVWTDSAKTDVRGISKSAAMQVLSAVDRFVKSGIGDVAALQGKAELRLRAGDYRIFSSDLIPIRSKFAGSGIAKTPTGDPPRPSLFSDSGRALTMFGVCSRLNVIASERGFRWRFRAR